LTQPSALVDSKRESVPVDEAISQLRSNLDALWSPWLLLAFVSSFMTLDHGTGAVSGGALAYQRAR